MSYDDEDEDWYDPELEIDEETLNIENWGVWPDYPFDDDQSPGAWEYDYATAFNIGNDGMTAWDSAEREFEWADYAGYEYPDDEPVSLLERIWNEIKYRWQKWQWRLRYFWNYRLNMRRCPGCGKLARFGNHDDCNQWMPF